MKHFPINFYEDNSFVFKNPEIANEVRLIMGDCNISYDDFVKKFFQSKNEHVVMTINGLDEISSNSKILTLKHVYHFWMTFVTGEKLYYIDNNLALALMSTRVSIQPHLIRSPFKSIFVAIDPSCQLKISGKVGSKNVCGIYISLINNELRYFATTLQRFEDNWKGEGVSYYARYNLRQNARNLDDIIKDSAKNRDSDIKSSSEIRESVEWTDFSEVTDVFKFCVNVLLYITSNGALLKDIDPRIPNLKKNPAKARKFEEKLSKTCQKRFILVGDGYYPKTNGITNVGGGITCKFEVEGHWRNQWYGSNGNEYQKPKWIEPFIKGKEFAQELNNKRIVV